MNIPDYFQCNPVFNLYPNPPVTLSNAEPYLDLFTNEIRWKKVMVPIKIYISKYTKNDMSNLDNWPIKLEKK